MHDERAFHNRHDVDVDQSQHKQIAKSMVELPVSSHFQSGDIAELHQARDQAQHAAPGSGHHDTGQRIGGQGY